MPEEKPEEKQEEKRRTTLIIDGETGNLLVHPEQEEYRSALERKWEERRKKIREEEYEKEKIALITLNTQRINGPPGEAWLSGDQLVKMGIPEFQLFKLVFYKVLTPYDSNGEEVWPREMPDADPSESTEEYPLESKKAAIKRLLSCSYSISNLLEIPELATIIKPHSARTKTGFDKETLRETIKEGIREEVTPILKEGQKALLKKDRKIKNLTPHAIRGKKVLQGAKNAGRSKTQVYRDLRKLYQLAAERIWAKNPSFSKLRVAKKLVKGIADLNKSWDDSSPLSKLATLLSDNDLKPNCNTIRRIISKT